MQQKLTSELNAVINGNTVFALDLYAGLRHVKGNLFFSPHSISTALAMTYAGARGDSEQQMSRALRFTVSQEQLHPAFACLQARVEAVQEKRKIRLSVANSLWPQAGYPFLQTFLALVKEYYGVLITPVNYVTAYEQARLEINTWVEQKTENKIRELIQAGVLDHLTRLVLVNAIYFKGDWRSQFDKRFTEEAAFWLTSNDSVMVPMMAQTGEFGYAEDGDLQILELPYAGDDLSMIVLLPRAVDGLAQLENTLSLENLTRWLGATERMEVQVSLPRFKLTCGYRLEKPLAAMGMIDAFDQQADFSGMDGRKGQEGGMFLSAVIHQAFVEVNEEGTEASAATATVMSKLGIPAPAPVFRADHPFLFLILDRVTRSILFIGRLAEPAPT